MRLSCRKDGGVLLYHGRRTPQLVYGEHRAWVGGHRVEMLSDSLRYGGGNAADAVCTRGAVGDA
jgi:hypothetical protein